MLKAYTYTPTEIGLERWPEGELRLEGTTPVTDPAEADVFVFPGPLSLAHSYGLDRLPHMSGNESRHVFLDVSDNWIDAIGSQSILIRCNLRTWMMEKDPNSIPFPWPVEDFAECVAVPEGRFKYDVSFQGWSEPSEARRLAPHSCRINASLTCDIATYPDFTGYLRADDPELARRRSEFRRSMRESRVALCPESIPGVLPYRFFEAMSAGRVPVLVSSDYVLPFDEAKRYSPFILRVEREDAHRAGDIIRDFLDRTSDAELVAKGRQARDCWLMWLNSADWPQLMTAAVERHLEKQCASR